MKTFMVIVSGHQIVFVDAKNEDSASDKVQECLCEYTELRDWQIEWVQEAPKHPDKSDFDIWIALEEVNQNERQK